MNHIKICILGADAYTCQIPRIKEGMKALGHTLTKDSPDLIYSNDPRGYDEALKLKEKYPKAYFSNSVNLFHLIFIFYFRLFLLRALLFLEPIFLLPLCFFGYPILTYSPLLFF